MDAEAALTRIVAGVARGLLAEGGALDQESDADVAEAFRVAVGEMDPDEYEELLLTLPEEALYALAASGYVTTSHLMYACGRRDDVPDGVAGYLAGVLVRVADADVMERFVGNAWFGYAFGLTQAAPPAARPRGASVVAPEAAHAATGLLKAAMVGAGFSGARAEDVLARVSETGGERAVEMPEAYVQAAVLAALTPCGMPL